MQKKQGETLGRKAKWILTSGVFVCVCCACMCVCFCGFVCVFEMKTMVIFRSIVIFLHNFLSLPPFLSTHFPRSLHVYLLHTQPAFVLHRILPIRVTFAFTFFLPILRITHSKLQVLLGRLSVRISCKCQPRPLHTDINTCPLVYIYIHVLYTYIVLLP